MEKNTYYNVVFNAQLGAMKNLLASLNIEAKYNDSFLDNDTSITIQATEAELNKIEEAMPDMCWLNVTDFALPNRYL